MKVSLSEDQLDEEWQHVAMLSGLLLFSWFWGAHYVVTSGKVKSLPICTCMCCGGAPGKSDGWMEGKGVWAHDLENGAGMFEKSLKRL